MPIHPGCITMLRLTVKPIDASLRSLAISIWLGIPWGPCQATPDAKYLPSIPAAWPEACLVVGQVELPGHGRIRGALVRRQRGHLGRPALVGHVHPGARAGGHPARGYAPQGVGLC